MPLIRQLKWLALALLGTAWLWTAPALAAGTLPLAMAQQIDINGKPLAGCQVYFFVAGTVASPQNSFSDFGLTQNPNPILQCDQSGRIPMFWLADGLVHVRLTDSFGLQIIDTTMQVLGPSSGGGGGGGTVDPTSIMSTGDLKAKYGTGALAGFVRTNGLTIGNATSGATERATADTQPLFIYLYTTDPNLVVSGGRTGNALNDYNASKTITLPDWSGQALAALDDQGAGPRGKLTLTYFGVSPTVLGASGGSQSHTLALSEAPAGITTSGANTINVANASQNITASGANSITASGVNTISVNSTGNPVVNDTGGIASSGAAGGTHGQFADVNAVHEGSVPSSGSNTINVANASQNISVSGTNSISASGSNTITGTSTNTGGAAHSIVPPMKLATIYIKL